MTDAPVPSEMKHYCRVILDKWTRRRMMEAANAVQKLAMSGEPDAIGRAQALFAKIEDGAPIGQYTSLPAMLDDGLDRYERLHKNGGILPGVPSGFPDLDKYTAGFQAGTLAIIAGRPAMGKTALAFNMGRAAVLRGHAVGFISLEMSREQLTDRLIASESGVKSATFCRGNFTREDWTRVSAAADRLSEADFFVDDSPGLSHVGLSARVRRLVFREKVEIVFIDYLQLMSGDRGQGRVEEVASISRALKSAAREHNIPVVALSQLSRAVEAPRQQTAAFIGPEGLRGHRTGCRPGSFSLPRRGLQAQDRRTECRRVGNRQAPHRADRADKIQLE